VHPDRNSRPIDAPVAIGLASAGISEVTRTLEEIIMVTVEGRFCFHYIRHLYPDGIAQPGSVEKAQQAGNQGSGDQVIR